MERLTDPCWKNLDPWECCGQDYFCKRGCHEEGGCTNGCIVPKIYVRLASLEDTGVSLEKVSWMKEVVEAAFDNDTSRIERAHNLHVADKEGRVVVLPCKVGDTVFARLDNKSKYVCECKVKQIVVGNIGFVTFAPIGAPEREYDVSLRGFGKTVFFSREEAEKALQKMEDKKDG